MLHFFLSLSQFHILICSATKMTHYKILLIAVLFIPKYYYSGAVVKSASYTIVFSIIISIYVYNPHPVLLMGKVIK